MEDKEFILNAKRARQVHALFLKEKIEHSHIVLLTEIVVRKIHKRSLPNVKWLQTELQISFTKVKSILKTLEARGFIIKKNSYGDKRVKFIDITKAGNDFIYKVTGKLAKPGN